MGGVNSSPIGGLNTIYINTTHTATYRTFLRAHFARKKELKSVKSEEVREDTFVHTTHGTFESVL